MQLEKLIKNLRLLAKLVEQQRTGTPQTLAKRLGVTDRTVRNYIGMLRDMGGDIAYSLRNQTYYLRTPSTFYMGFSPDDAEVDSACESQALAYRRGKV
ncbi:MAG: helix-turn-helix domain-containing protein [Tenuifilaceae bacterium]|jgi:predicted DNA-binding transcriptional regulator YafY|nr:helix-turn-helix domain-containing protein [Tenuifilaceae bacterium]